jgi:1-acyl-sn-glycerol-3-phosphate acyltransferase
MRRLLELGYGVYAALAVGLAVLVIGPLSVLLPTLAARRAAGRFGVRCALMLIGIPVRISGLHKLPPGPCLVVSNHASYLDGPLLTAALPSRFTFVVQHGAADWPIAGPIIRGMGVTFVNRGSARTGASQTRALIRRLEQGHSLVVFPEGTFVDTPGLLPFRKGAFLMAVHANVPVVPAVIRGSRRFFGEGRRLPRWCPITMELFDPIMPGAAGEHRGTVETLRDSAREVVLAHCGEPDQAAAHATDD